MTKDHDKWDAERGDAVFDAGDHRVVSNIAGNAGGEEIAEALVEDELWRDSGVGTTEYGREWRLASGKSGAPGEILARMEGASFDVALIALHQPRQ